jgi:hypothetical protein
MLSAAMCQFSRFLFLELPHRCVVGMAIELNFGTLKAEI